MVTDGSDLLSQQFGLLDLLNVGGSGRQGFRQMIHGQLPNTGTNIHGLYAVAPEELVAEERLNDSRKPGC